MESTAVWNLQAERWRSPLLQKYQEEKTCEKRQQQQHNNNNIYSNKNIHFSYLLFCSLSFPLGFVCWCATRIILFFSDLDIQKFFKRPRPNRSVRLDDILGFIIKGTSNDLVSVPKFIFSLIIPRKQFPTQWELAVMVSVYKKCNNACLNSQRTLSLLSNFTQIFKRLIQDL
jgi:hypothetical protein